MKLYQYHHCPFCVRADMVANYKQVEHEKVYLLNDDERSCFDLIGAKMVPILAFDDGSAMGESLDIVAKLDALGNANRLILPQAYADKYTSVLAPVGDEINRLLFPRNLLIELPEFATQSAKDYFQNKKEAMINMPFSQAMEMTEVDKQVVSRAMANLPAFELNPVLGMDDVLVYPILRNLSMVKDLLFPTQVRVYIEHVAAQTGTETYFDRAV